MPAHVMLPRNSVAPGMRSPPDRRQLRLFWLLATFLILVALTGGSSRTDILGLVILRPASILLCAIAAWTISVADFQRCRFGFVLLAGLFALTLLHLIPLPPAIWTALPGRGIVATLDRQAGLGSVWRPLSLAPSDTLAALYSLFVPLAVLLAGTQLERTLRERLLLIVLGIASFSALLALLQLAADGNGALFFYTRANQDPGAGLFANRNHQAVLLAAVLPMLATIVTTADARRRGWIGIAAAAGVVVLVPLLLVAGSRAGTLIAAAALVASLWLLPHAAPGARHRHGAKAHWRDWLSPRIVALGGAAGIVVLVMATVAASRAASLTRLFGTGSQDELRFQVWPLIAAAIRTYFPVGSGIGSFVSVYQLTEPDAMLRPTYLNHAHSELLEVILTAGLPGALLLVVAIVGWLVATGGAFRARLIDRGVPFARLGVVIAAVLALGSLADYPLRTPLLAALLALSTLWASRARAPSAK